MTKLSDSLKEMSELSEELQNLEDELYLLDKDVVAQSFDTYKDYTDIISHPDGEGCSIHTLIRELQQFADKHQNAIFYPQHEGESAFLRVDRIITRTMIDERIEEIKERIKDIKKRIKKIDTNIQDDINNIDKE